MHYLIVIAVAGKPKAVDRLIERIDTLVMEETMQGGIGGLTTEVVKGAAAEAVRDRIRGEASSQAAPAPSLPPWRPGIAIGDGSACAQCDATIVWNGTAWVHIGAAQPRHIAWPKE